MVQHEELHNAALAELLAGCKPEPEDNEDGHRQEEGGEGSGLPFDLSLADVSILQGPLDPINCHVCLLSLELAVSDVRTRMILPHILKLVFD